MTRSLLLASGAALGLGILGGWTMTSGPKEEPESSPPRNVLEKTGRLTSRERATDAAHLSRIVAEEDPLVRLRGMIEFALRIPDDALFMWWEEERFLTGDRCLDRLFGDIIANRLAGVDPERAMRGSRGQMFVAYWARLDVAAAQAYVMQGGDPAEIHKFAPAILEELAQQDSAAALALIGRIQEIEGNESGRAHRALRELARTARDATLAASEHWPKAWRELVRQTIAEEWLQEDFGAGLNWFRDQEGGLELFVKALFQAQRSSMDLLAHHADLPVGWLAAAAQHRAEDVVRGNPLGWLRADAAELGLEPALHQRLMQSAMRGLRPEHRDEIPELLEKFPESLQRQLLELNARNWHLGPRTEVEAWIATLPSEELQDSARRSFRGLWESQAPLVEERRDPGELVEAVASGEASAKDLRDRTWTPEEAVAATEVFRGLPEPERQQAVAALLRGGVPEWMIGEAYRDVLERGGGRLSPDDLAGREGMRGLCDHAADWGRSDPMRAAAWAAALPAGEGRTWALRNVALGWAEQAPSAVRRWANSLEDAADRAVILDQLEE